MKELELKGKQMEMEVRMREMDVRMRELDVAAERRDSSHSFDVAKNVRLVPTFKEDRVGEYFQHFEKLAINLNWPKEAWPTLVQSSLCGKAQEVYAALTVVQCADYECVKSNILRAYELVPEAHRQLFRNSRKQEEQTYVEFVQKKELHLERWLASVNVNDFDQQLLTQDRC